MALALRRSRRHVFKHYSTQAMNSQEVADAALRNVDLPKIKAMEKDLHALESNLANSAKKTDLNVIKKKWGLKSDTYGSSIPVPAARQALANELRQNIRLLQNRHQGDASFSQTALPGAIISAVADSQESSSRTAAPSSQQNSRLAVAFGGAAALASIAYVLARPKVETVHEAHKEDPSIPVHQSRPSETPVPNGTASVQAAPIQGTKGSKGQGSSGSNAGDTEAEGKTRENSPSNKASTTSSQDDAKVKAVGAEVTGGTSGTDLAVDPRVLAAVSLVVIGLGFWWIWRQRGPPLEIDTLDTSMQPTPDVVPTKALPEGPSEPILPPRQAGEVIFENAPKDGQVWDMSASVRGIKGGVQEKINQFER